MDKPLGLSTELATLRALTHDFIDRYEENRDQLAAWYADREKARPPRILDQYDASKLLDDVGKMVARIEKISSQDAVSRPELLRLMGEMGRIVARRCDEQTANEIAEEWGQSRI